MPTLRIKLNYRFLKVTFFAAFVLLVETVLFHVLMYIHEYFSATAVISHAVLGIGLGAFAASRIRARESLLFYICTLGLTLSLYGTSFILVTYPVLWAIAAGTAACVFFPLVYITVLFKEYPGGRIYLYDMAGAFLGVLFTVVFYEFLSSEEIILVLVTVIPLIGIIQLVISSELSRIGKVIASGIALPFVVIGCVLLCMQLTNKSFDIFKIFNRDAPYELRKIIKTQPPDQLVKSYDSLVERLDIIDSKDVKKGYTVCYNGYKNDHFTPEGRKEYEWHQKRGQKWPSGDQRVFYGLTKLPSVYIIGAAARGITETIKKVTLPEKVMPVEIDPSIVQVMAKDFYNESGKAYHRLNPIVGNALSLLKTLDRKFDAITLINTHSSRNIGTPAGPDFLHTKESYGLYLDHLTKDGYILFEERPFNRSGDFGFYRMLNTLWHTLAERGVRDPSKHFFIWEWEVGDAYPRIDKSYKKDSNFYNRASIYYIGMIVTKSPIKDKRRDKVMEWYHSGVSMCRISYLKDIMEWGETSNVMKMIETDNFAPLEKEGFDKRIITNDIPFASLSTIDVPEINTLIRSEVVIFLVLTTLFLFGMFYGADKGRAVFLSTYNILIGFGYFFVEIMLLQVYQNIFVSPAWTLVLVLGFLLLSSGLGGMYTHNLKPWQITAMLVPVTILSIYSPGWLVASFIPAFITKAISIMLVCATGFLMGFYFPRGLELADRWELKHKVPHLFALNSVAGSFAVILALYSGVRIGYQATIVVAVICYCIAGLMAVSAKRKNN